MELFIDSVHHYSTAELADKWTVVSPGVFTDGAASTFTVVPEGRTANAIKMEWTGNGASTPGYIEVAPLMTEYGPWTPNTKGVCGFAIKVQDLTKLDMGPIANNRYFFGIFEGAANIFHVKLNTNGTFSHHYHTESPFDNGYVGASTQGLRSNTWSYVEFKWTVASAVDSFDGHWTTRLNTIDLFSFTGRVYGTSFSLPYSGIWNAVRVLNYRLTTGVNTASWLCDFYLADQETHSTDYVVSDFLGDATFGAIYGNGVGTYSELTPTAGANWENTSEHPPDEDTTTVTGTTPGLRDRYQMQDVPSGAVILGYQSVIRAKKTTIGAAILDPVIRIGGTDYVATGQGVASADKFAYILQPYDNDLSNPSQQLPEATANAMEAGFNKEV